MPRFIGPVVARHVDKFDHTAVWPAGVPFPVVVEKGEARFDFETRGPWNTISSIKALAVEKGIGAVVVHGVRKLQNAHESSYVHEGRVSVEGETRRAFTSSQLFLVEGKLVDVAILYVCSPKETTKETA